MLKNLILVVVLSCCSVFGVQPRNGLTGRIVAYDRFQGLTNPYEPTQTLILELITPKSEEKLVRLVYFAPTNGMRGGARFLDNKILQDETVSRFRVHQPSTEREEDICGRADSFFRSLQNVIDEDEKGEPLLRFRSTQFAADMKFDRIEAMPCLILDSIAK